MKLNITKRAKNTSLIFVALAGLFLTFQNFSVHGSSYGQPVCTDPYSGRYACPATNTAAIVTSSELPQTILDWWYLKDGKINITDDVVMAGFVFRSNLPPGPYLSIDTMRAYPRLEYFVLSGVPYCANSSCTEQHQIASTIDRKLLLLRVAGRAVISYQQLADNINPHTVRLYDANNTYKSAYDPYYTSVTNIPVPAVSYADRAGNIFMIYAYTEQNVFYSDKRSFANYLLPTQMFQASSQMLNPVVMGSPLFNSGIFKLTACGTNLNRDLYCTGLLSYSVTKYNQLGSNPTYVTSILKESSSPAFIKSNVCSAGIRGGRLYLRDCNGYKFFGDYLNDADTQGVQFTDGFEFYNYTVIKQAPYSARVTYSDFADLTCYLNSQTISSGGSVAAYPRSNVPYGSTCSAETRTCTNGFLTGTATAPSCAVAVPVNCTFNGQSVAHGAAVTAYPSSSLPYGSTCSSETRTCTNGMLSGSATSASCTVATSANCTFNGQTITNGSSIVAYPSNTAPYGSTCSSETRTCTNGMLSGTATAASCTPSLACPANLASVAPGITGTCSCSLSAATGTVYGANPSYSTDSGLCRSALHAGFTDTFGSFITFSTIGTAQSFAGSTANGVTTLSRSTSSQAYKLLGRACYLNSQIVASSSTVAAYPASTVPYGSTCTKTTFTCGSNGLLSGPSTTPSASCAIAPPPANCTFNGQTVLNGTSVTAYLSSTNQGIGCTKQTRSCSLGVLSGSYAYASCL